MTIYLDTCALNRLADNHSQARVRDEADAVTEILDLVADRHVSWLISDAVFLEVSRNPDALRRAQTLPLLNMASGRITTTPELLAQASLLQQNAIAGFDALHLAACTLSAVEFLLTVDDRFIARAARRAKPAVTEVLNPLDWLQRRKTWQPIP